MKASLTRHIVRFAMILLIGSALCACRISYKLNGAAIDYNVYKTIYVSNFPIRAALVYPPLQQTFENELLDYITRNTRLRTIQVRVHYTDARAEGKDIDQTFSAYRDFDSSEMLTDVQDELCSQISRELVELIFNATLGDW